MTHARVRTGTPGVISLGARICALTVAGFLLLGLAVPASASASTLGDRRASVLSMTNKIRKAHGCKPLVLSRKLTNAAQKHADDMSRNNYISHTSLSGRTWDNRIRAAGYSDPGGENIALGFNTAKGVVKAWMNSPDHRRNILTCSFKKIGVGSRKVHGVWVQDFGY